MSIRYNEQARTITIDTKNSSYQMQIDQYGFLHHLYYGKKIGDMDMSYVYMDYDRACAGNPDEVYPSRVISFNTMPQEYTGYGVGDHRINSIAIVNEDGSYGADFRYVKHEIRQGKYGIKGLPAAYDNGDEAETLIVTIQDKVTLLKVELLYGVFEEKDVITRAARIINEGEEELKLNKASSMSIDFPYGKWDFVHFHGKHALERQMERNALTHSVQVVQSTRGTSSHQQNPFVILCDRKANEDSGSCYGFMFVYSGGFKAEAEVDQFDSTRVVMGIQDEQFSWKLRKGECFDTPEVIMSYSCEGFTTLSHNYHDIVRNNICRGKYKLARRPILINNWEATYFDFNDEKLLNIADEASQLGIELLVLDDGWFGLRNDDNAGLGDWFVNEDKIKCGLKNLIEKINEKGLKFGIWVEPEMVNEDSDLFRTHPDWPFFMPNRVPTRTRNQLVLDLGREDVREYLYQRLSSLLRENHIEYVKWDMNRSLSDVYSRVIPKENQGEALHRYMLGLYELMERLTTEFPDVLIEGCSGGGARFDAGIMYYSPQIWCSDNTDPIHRLNIQYGSSFAYPVSTVGAHVSASPNHQTGRSTPFSTRGVVAMSGTFGYELDPGKLSYEEKEQMKEQIYLFKKYYDLIQNGKYYRLTEIKEECYEAWQFASKDQKEALLNVVITNTQPNPTLMNIHLKGLDEEGIYQEEGTQKTYLGSALMYGGYTFPWVTGDYPAMQVHFVRVN